MDAALTGVLERFRTLLIEKREAEIRQIEDRAQGLLDRQILDEGDACCGGWGDVKGIEDNALSYSGTTFVQMLGLARAWATPGSRFEGDAEVARRLNLAWKFYRGLVHVGCPFPNNWWAWQVGIPMHLGDVMLLAADAFENGAREEIVAFLGYLVEHIRTEMTGANGMWGAMNYLRYGLITDNADYVDRASKWAARECEIRPVNGILKDYSYSFHGSAVHMGYGRSHFADVGRYVYVMGDSPWQLAADALSNYVNWLLEFIRWTVVGEGIDPFIIGREVSRGETALLATSIIDGALLAGSAPIPRRDEVLAFCRQAMADGLTPSNPVAAELAGRLTGAACGPLYGVRYWPQIEYFAARRARFAASVKLSSPQTKSWFSIANENVKGWHTSDGHLILRPRADAFRNGVMPTMDWLRLTGITRADGFQMPREKEGQSPFVCGLADETGTLGCCGVDFLIQREDGTALRAKKSWFFIGDAIVALGSDISCDGPVAVETVIRQAALPEGVGASDRREETLTHFAGRDCAYIFPGGMRVQVYAERRSGRWNEINLRREGKEETLTRTFAFVVAPHGVRPAGAEYAVIYLPGWTAEAAASWWAESPLDIVQRDSEAHVVRDSKSGRTLAVRWGLGAEVG